MRKGERPMAIEIERKFLVLSDEWRTSASYFRRFRQGYLARSLAGSVRVRRWDSGATLAVKGPRHGITRDEYEYEIPLEEADEMLRCLCVRPLLEKVRHWVEHAGSTWEVDVYCGAAKGLVLAEIELDECDQLFAVPRWVGSEVTQNPYYSNAAIAARAAAAVETARTRFRRKYAEGVGA